MAEGVTLERWKRLLALVDILEPLPPEEIKRLAASRSFIQLGAGEILVLEENRRSRPTHEVVDTWLSQRCREIPSVAFF
jgi:hypothetical protein